MPPDCSARRTSLASDKQAKGDMAMRLAVWGMAGAALVMAGAISSASAGANVGRPDVSAADIIAGRQAAYRLSAALFGQMKAAIDRGDDVKGQAFPARALAGWAKALPGMFPAGTGVSPSHALPLVWSDRADFEAKAATYAAEAGKLADLAKAGDKAGFATQWGVVRDACGACHDKFKAPEERKPG